MRVDIWLFQARLFKSRTQATEACKEGRVYRSERKLDPSDLVKAGELIELRDRGLYRSYRILELPLKNMSKDAAKTTYQDETKEEILQRFEQMRNADRKFSDSGAKPSKKDRRVLDKFRNRR